MWEPRHNFGAYDAAYIALAEALGCELLTGDTKLKKAAGHRATVVRTSGSGDASAGAGRRVDQHRPALEAVTGACHSIGPVRRTLGYQHEHFPFSRGQLVEQRSEPS